ncbi:hypothetical protein N9D66_01880 [Candidatus Nanopelagicales bacterium]|nr:hypothetical protein [Candidatus Nanopelagicales bacterium]
MATPERTTAQRIIGTVGIALVTTLVVILVGTVTGIAAISNYLAVPVGVGLGLWWFYSTRPVDQGDGPNTDRRK